MDSSEFLNSLTTNDSSGGRKLKITTTGGIDNDKEVLTLSDPAGGRKVKVDLEGYAEFVQAVTDLEALTVSTIKYVLADQSTSSITASNITDLVFAVSASTKYSIEGIIRCGNDGLDGIKMAITVPSGTFWVSFLSRVNSNDTSRWSFASASGTLTTAFDANIGPNNCVLINGTITIGATPGNIQFQFASTTAGQTTTVYSEGSVLQLTPLS